MSFRTLVPTTALTGVLDAADVAIVDCRFVVDDPEWGRRAYAVAHVPGAVFAHMDHDLAGPKDGRNGRHPLPDPAVLAATFGRMGIGNDTRVVVYDQDSGMYASRMWWLLRWLGHEAVGLLDGGFAKWVAEGRPTCSGIELRSPLTFRGEPRREMAVTADEAAAIAPRPGWRLVDARAPERYRGEVETLDARAGHIPGAVNYFYKWNVAGDGTLKPPAELRSGFERQLGDVSPNHIVCYCGSGVTACHNVLALEHAGLPGAKVYVGSWSEWSGDAGREIETGPQPSQGSGSV